MANSADLQLGIRDEVAALKKARTITAAVELFYERGYENTTLDAVAERMGVTKPFIYAHFDSKGELLAEICSRGIGSSLKVIETVMAMKATPARKLRLFSEQFVAAVLNSQMHVAVFSREEKNLAAADLERINAMRRQFDRKLAELLDEGNGSGDFDVPDTHLTALAIGGMVSWAVGWYRPSGRLSIDEVSVEMSRLILRMTSGESEGGTRRRKRPSARTD